MDCTPFIELIPNVDQINKESIPRKRKLPPWMTEGFKKIRKIHPKTKMPAMALNEYLTAPSKKIARQAACDIALRLSNVLTEEAASEVIWLKQESDPLPADTQLDDEASRTMVIAESKKEITKPNVQTVVDCISRKLLDLSSKEQAEVAAKRKKELEQELKRLTGPLNSMPAPNQEVKNAIQKHIDDIKAEDGPLVTVTTILEVLEPNLMEISLHETAINDSQLLLFSKQLKEELKIKKCNFADGMGIRQALVANELSLDQITEPSADKVVFYNDMFGRRVLTNLMKDLKRMRQTPGEQVQTFGARVRRAGNFLLGNAPGKLKVIGGENQPAALLPNPFYIKECWEYKGKQDFLDGFLLSTFMDGLIPKIANAICITFDDFETALRFAISVEDREKDLDSSRSSSLHQLYSNTRPKTPPYAFGGNGADICSATTCYNCGQKGHFRSKCCAQSKASSKPVTRKFVYLAPEKDGCAPKFSSGNRGSSSYHGNSRGRGCRRGGGRRAVNFVEEGNEYKGVNEEYEEEEEDKLLPEGYINEPALSYLGNEYQPALQQTQLQSCSYIRPFQTGNADPTTLDTNVEIEEIEDFDEVKQKVFPSAQPKRLSPPSGNQEKPIEKINDDTAIQPPMENKTEEMEAEIQDKQPEDVTNKSAAFDVSAPDMMFYGTPTHSPNLEAAEVKNKSFASTEDINKTVIATPKSSKTNKSFLSELTTELGKFFSPGSGSDNNETPEITLPAVTDSVLAPPESSSTPRRSQMLLHQTPDRGATAAVNPDASKSKSQKKKERKKEAKKKQQEAEQKEMEKKEKGNETEPNEEKKSILDYWKMKKAQKLL
ncbi:unnamed protein product [Notodromas monacha]|uniref:CCHC-type domain-containing protein n=1 Tax=Notodromas monacha TaxID=399045 RepID=A0A7R9BQR0_9CRUS|nr:unnamed protein product [Notodromas monacha]CAG0918857.1 unnamed protein product [Notodromas monacha]